MVKKAKRRRPQILITILVIFLSFLFIYPFWHTLMISFSDTVSVNKGGFFFWPKNFNLDSYRMVFKDDSIWIGYKNTIIIAVAETTLQLVVSFCAAYAMSDHDLPGWKVINILLAFTMFFGGGLIPTYLNMKTLGLINTRWALILPGAAGVWSFIVMRTFLGNVSKELQEAALIDGAGTIKTMILIVLPLSKPIIAVTALKSVIADWNAWFSAMLYANKKELMVLQTVIRRLIEEGDASVAAGEVMTMADAAPATMRAATIMAATIPILIAYPFAQKYLVKGTMVGSLKG